VEIRHVDQITESQERELIERFEMFEDAFEHREAESFVLVIEGGEIVGACQHVGHTLYVIQAKPNMGIGSAIIHFLKEWSGWDGLYAECAIPQVIGFYENLGFQKVSRANSAGCWNLDWYPE
jgi:GNAT superfamily N-acetyltransferase